MQITVNNLTKKYKKITALRDINLNINSPAMVGLVGPNGAGKSTLMKLIIGQLMPSSGSVHIDGQDLTQNSRYLRERLGYLPQDYGLYEELTVEQFLDYMACLKEIKKDKKAIISNCISLTNLDEKRKSKIKTLSGGQKQRVGIAQAMLNDPEIFIIDEPTVGLDPEERIKFRNLFAKGAREKLVILSTHIIEDVESICNRLIILNKGKILFDGLPSELINLAIGHVGIINEDLSEEILIKDNLRIIASKATTEGSICRVVGKELPSYCIEDLPSLEDAYIYCMMGEEE